MFKIEIKIEENCFWVNFDKIEEILKKKVRDLFVGSSLEEIDKLIKIEKENNDNSNQKKANLLLNENCKERFIKYLEDDNKIKIGKLNMELQGFETFEHHFEKDREEENNNIKKCIYLFLNEKIQKICPKPKKLLLKPNKIHLIIMIPEN